MKIKKICILTSGKSRGSNFSSIANYINNNKLPVEIAFVVVNNKNAPIIEKCIGLGITHKFISTKNIGVFEDTLYQEVELKQVDLIVFAGFMRKLSLEFINKVKTPIINIHPALLPGYGGKGMYGSAVHEAVFQAKEKFSGATIHYVNDEYDCGEIIAQEKVDISECKSAEEVGEAVLKIEHKLYPEIIWSLLEKL